VSVGLLGDEGEGTGLGPGSLSGLVDVGWAWVLREGGRESLTDELGPHWLPPPQL
jgi:hypothetical protein